MINSLLKNTGAIGVFDSGVGGLTVVSRLTELMPNEEIIYFGDTARVPYGSKGKETITKFSFEIADFLIDKGVKAIVVACNTIAVSCQKELMDYCPVPVFGVIEPGVSAIMEVNGIKKAAVIGTVRTVNSQFHKNMINSHNKDIEVFTKACPLFVPIVEEGILEGDIPTLTVRYYLQELLEKDIQGLLLACTHFPLLYGIIKDYMVNVEIIDPAEKTAQTIKDYLHIHGLLNPDESVKKTKFYLSDYNAAFAVICSKALANNYQPEIISI